MRSSVLPAHGPSEPPRWLVFVGLVLLVPVIAACASTHVASHSVTGTWTGEWYNSRAGVPYTLSLRESSKGRLEGSMQVDGVHSTLPVQGSITRGRIILSLPGGAVMKGTDKGGKWSGSFSEGGTRWNFRFVRQAKTG